MILQDFTIISYDSLTEGNDFHLWTCSWALQFLSNVHSQTKASYHASMLEHGGQSWTWCVMNLSIPITITADTTQCFVKTLQLLDHVDHFPRFWKVKWLSYFCCDDNSASSQSYCSLNPQIVAPSAHFPLWITRKNINSTRVLPSNESKRESAACHALAFSHEPCTVTKETTQNASSGKYLGASWMANKCSTCKRWSYSNYISLIFQISRNTVSCQTRKGFPTIPFPIVSGHPRHNKVSEPTQTTCRWIVLSMRVPLTSQQAQFAYTFPCLQALQSNHQSADEGIAT